MDDLNFLFSSFFVISERSPHIEVRQDRRHDAPPSDLLLVIQRLSMGPRDL